MKQLLIFSLLVLLSGGACRKQAVEPAVGCDYVVTITPGIDSYTYTYRFDAANRLTSLLYNSVGNLTNYVYAYQGSQVTIEVTYQGINYLKAQYALTLNGQGYVVTAQKTNVQTLSTGTVEESIEAVHTFSYDADGYLTAHRRDQFRYPVGEPKRMETYQEQFVYQNGNPVTITYSNEGNESVAKARGTITNKYGTPANLLKIPFQLEANSGFSLDPAFQPLLGKPPRTLLDRSDESRGYDTRTETYANRYDYQFDAKGQVLRATQQPGTPNTYYVKPPSFAFDNRCP